MKTDLHFSFFNLISFLCIMLVGEHSFLKRHGSVLEDSLQKNYTEEEILSLNNIPKARS